MLSRVLVSVAVVAACVATACAAPLWGQDGHQVTALVAQNYLTTAAASRASDILDGQTLEDVSTWADSVKKTPAYSWSAVLHYINTPDWACDYEPSRDCSDSMCVAGAIYNYTNRLVTQTDHEQVQEALKFLVHFYGDIHQPLHVAFASDEGGNTIQGTFEDQSSTLHGVWDVPMVELSVNNRFGSVDGYAKFLISQIDGTWKGNTTVTGPCSDSSTTVCPDEWATSTAALACSNAYVDQYGTVIKSGFNLGEDYYNHNYPVVDMQLARGGIRLANTLNALLGGSTALAYFQSRQ